MFIIDSLLSAPLRGLLFVFEKINDAAREETEAQERTLMADLSALHQALDEGAITEPEFDAREHQLLDRLDRLHAKGGSDADARS
jgi:hypothetical protein